MAALTLDQALARCSRAALVRYLREWVFPATMLHDQKNTATRLLICELDELMAEHRKLDARLQQNRDRLAKLPLAHIHKRQRLEQEGLRIWRANDANFRKFDRVHKHIEATLRKGCTGGGTL